MDVLYTCDNNYVWLMGISTISMFENNKKLKNIHVWLLGENITDENKEILKNIAEKYNRKITVIDVPPLDIPDSLVSKRWPISAFTRLYCGELLPKALEKVLYLDCDTIINGNLEELENWDVSENVFWGVKDCIGKRYKTNIGIDPDGIYVNAGVLLINLVELRKITIKNRLNDYIKKYEKLINYADQDVLNGTFCKAIGFLPPEYDVMTIASTYSYKDILRLRRPTNYYSYDELQNAVSNPVLIHYTTNMLIVRPWFLNTNHPFANEFNRYMSISPWKNRELTEMRFNNSESKVISIVEKMPKKISLYVLGILHSEIKPLVILLKSKRG